MRYKFIDTNKAMMPVQRMCRMMAVSVSGYYALKERKPSLHQCYDVVLAAHIRAQFACSYQTYGAPRMYAELREEGLSVGRHRVARLMRENGLKAHQKRRFKKTTDSHHDCLIAFNVLDQNFACNGPVQKWGADISYIWTAEGWLYLAIVLNLYSRRCVGWATSDRSKKGQALKALNQAILMRQPPVGLIHHSPSHGLQANHCRARDRGSQYCSDDYRRLLQTTRLIASKKRQRQLLRQCNGRDCLQTIKTELIWRARYETRDHATFALGHYIDGYYNPRRRRSALGYKSPITFEPKMAEVN